MYKHFLQKGPSVKKNKRSPLLLFILVLALIASGCLFYFVSIQPKFEKTRVVRSLSSSLKHHDHKAELLITEVFFDKASGKVVTRAEFSELSPAGKTTIPGVLVFSGNVLQLQSMVVDLEGIGTDHARFLKNRKIRLFWKAYLPDGPYIEQFELSPINSIPKAYKVAGAEKEKENRIWADIWSYALEEKNKNSIAIKNVKIEAKGPVFIPGTLFLLSIQEDGTIGVERRDAPLKQ